MGEISVKDFSREYWSQHLECIKRMDLEMLEKIVGVLLRAHRSGKKVYAMGNGGSAATASHLACDLNKTAAVKGRPRFKVISINDNVPVMLAIANDIRYEEVFAEQLENFLESQDVVFLISGSGNSPNLLRAAEFARSRGAVTVALLGFEGGKLKAMVDHPFVVPSRQYGVIEDLHMSICHFLTFYFKKLLSLDASS